MSTLRGNCVVDQSGLPALSEWQAAWQAHLCTVPPAAARPPLSAGRGGRFRPGRLAAASTFLRYAACWRAVGTAWITCLPSAGHQE